MNEQTRQAMIFSALVSDAHWQNGGSSTSIDDPHTPITGYMVSLRGYEQKQTGKWIAGYEILDYLRENVPNAKRMNAGELYIGTWWNEQDGNSYIDLSINVRDKGTALQIAATNKQIAIYDVKNRQSILV